MICREDADAQWVFGQRRVRVVDPAVLARLVAAV